MKVFPVFLLLGFFLLPQDAYAAFADDVEADGAVSHWSFDQTSGDVSDMIGFATGTATGTLSRTNAGLVGNGFQFTTNTGVDLPNGYFSSQSQGAIEAIVRTGKKDDILTIFSKGLGQVAGGTAFFCAVNDGHLSAFGTGLNVRANRALNPDTWYHLVCENTGTTMRMYVNGAEESLIYTTGSASTESWLNDGGGSPAQFSLGYIHRGAGDTSYMTGLIDDVALYSSPKNPAVWMNHWKTAFNSSTSWVSIISPLPYQVFQRSTTTNLGTITVSGTYSGSPTAIEAKWGSGDWTTIDSAPSGSIFNGSLTGQAVGQATLSLRFANETTITTSTSYVGVGDIFVIAGQSNASGRATNGQSYSHATLKAGMFDNNYNWRELEDYTDDPAGEVHVVSLDATVGGTVWPIVATRILASTSVPVAFLPVALGGSAISAWARNTAVTALYGAMYDRIKTAGGARAVLWWQGESDTIVGTQTTYGNALSLLVDDIWSDFSVPTVVGQIADWSVRSRPQLDNVRAAQKAVWASNTLAYVGPTLYDIDIVDEGGDGVHVKSDTDITTAANRWAAAILDTVYNTGDGRGPVLSSAETSQSGLKIALTFSDDSFPITPANPTTTMFLVKDDGVTTTVSSAATTSTNQLILTLGRSVTSSNVTVSIASGRDGNDLDALTLTDSSEYNLPVETAYNFAVTTNTVPTLSAIASSTANTSSTITWTSDEISTSQVEYGVTSTFRYMTTIRDTNAPTTTHSVTLQNLLPCTRYRYRARSYDAADNEATSSAKFFTTAGCSASAQIFNQIVSDITTDGGNFSLLENSIGAAITVPSGAVTTTMNFQIQRIAATTTLASFGRPSGFSAIGSHVYEYRALSDTASEVTSFDTALTISMTYADSEISGIDETTLVIYHWNGTSWDALSGCSVTAGSNSVSCSTTSFSPFALFGQTESAVASGPSATSPSVSNFDASAVGVAINSGALRTGSPIVRLTFSVIPEAVKFAVSKVRSYFDGIVQSAPLSSGIWWDLCSTPCASGIYTVYAKFFTSTGQGSAVVSSSIYYDPAGAPPPPSFVPPVEVPPPASTELTRGAPPKPGEAPVRAPAATGHRFVFLKDLRYGMRDNKDVKILQQFLNAHGFLIATRGAGSQGREHGLFNLETLRQVRKFQETYRADILVPAGKTRTTGNLAPFTRAHMNNIIEAEGWRPPT